MKPILPLLALLILGLTAAPAQEESAALPPLPGDTAWVLHLDWSRLLTGELGAWVDARLGPDSTAPAAAPVRRLIVGLQALEAATGFNLRRDVSTITVAGPDADPQRAVLWLRARLDTERLVPLLRLNPSYRSRRLGDRTLHEWREGGERLRIACQAGNDLYLFAQDEHALQAALGVIDNATLALDPATVFGLSTDESVFFLGLSRNLRQLRSMPQFEATVLRQIDSLNGSLSQKDGALRIVVSAGGLDQPRISGHMATVLEGLRSLVLLQLEHLGAADFAASISNDRGLRTLLLTPGDDGRPLLEAVLHSLAITREDQALSIQAAVPMAPVLRAVQAHFDRAAQR